MTRRSLRMTCIALLLAAPSSACADPAHVLSVGPFGAMLGGAGGLMGGAGLEVSLLRFENSMAHNAFLVGGVAQVAGLVRNEDAALYGMLGGEVAYGGIGLEGGAYAQSAGGGYGASAGVHLGAYLSLGVVYVSGGVHLPVAQESSPEPIGVQGFFFTGFKYPFTVGGSDPYRSLFSFSFR